MYAFKIACWALIFIFRLRVFIVSEVSAVYTVAIDQLRNLVTVPQCDMETRHIMPKHYFSCFLFQNVGTSVAGV